MSDNCTLCNIILTIEYSNVKGITTLEPYIEFKGEYICESCINKIVKEYAVIDTVPKRTKKQKIRIIIKSYKVSTWIKGYVHKKKDEEE